MSDELVLSNLRITRSEVDATAIKNFNFSVAARVLFWLNTHYQSMYNGVNPDFIKSAFQAILKNNYSDFRFGLMDESIDLKVRSLWCEDTCESSNSLVVKETSNPWDMLLATSIINGCCNIWSGSEVWRTLQAFCCPESKVIFVTDPNGNWLARAYLDARFSKKVIRVKLYKDTFSAFRVDCYQKKIGATPIKLMLRAIAKKASNLGNWKVDILAMNKWIGKYLTTFTPSLKELESKLNNVIRFSTEDDYNNYTDSE